MSFNSLKPIQAILLGVLIATSARQTSAAHHQQQQQQKANSDHSTQRNGCQQDTENSSGISAGSGIAGFLLAKGSDIKLNQSDGIDLLLADLLARVGPDMRPMRDFRDFHDITPEVAKRAWLLMHDHAQLAITDRMQFIEPIIGQLLIQANVSDRCSRAARNTIEAAKRLDSWAIQLLSAWGNFPPIGLYEGTFGDIGSYHGCLNVPENSVIRHAHYCTISFRPILAAQPDYELIIRREPEDLLRLFERHQGHQDATNEQVTVDAFTDLLEAAQYHHYIYYKLGTCFPIDCDPFDVQKLAKLVGRRSILLSGPVKCHSKRQQDYMIESNSSSSNKLEISTRDLNKGVYIWKPHMTLAQVISLIIVASISLFIIVMTILDVLLNVLPELVNQDKIVQSSTQIYHEQDSSALSSTSTELQQDRSLQMDPNNNISNFNANVSPTIERMESSTFIIKDDDEGRGQSDELRARQQVNRKSTEQSLFGSIIRDFSIVNNLTQFFQISESQVKNEISCINGIRCITMSWIVTTHTVQYNDWSAFARTRQVEILLQSLINQPLFNGSYLVDSFFLVSGLLTSYSTFGKYFRQNTSAAAAAEAASSSASKQQARELQRERMLANFSPISYLLGRYLRLTPQIIFVSLLFILLPLMTDSGGPHWYTITGEYSENCSQNWWVNLFHIQAFYRSNEMCNFVGWWISVDMFYHLFALVITLLILHLGHKLALLSCAILTLAHGVIQARRHYQLRLPPNLLSTIPQTGAMWSQMTLDFFWTPYAHALPYFFGFYLGYLMARDHLKLAIWFNAKRATSGWIVALISLAAQSYSTYFWVIGRWRYQPLQSSVFNLISALIWSLCLAWIILACQFGYGGPINRLLSCKLFMVLGKASYVVYLSHFLVLFTYFGGQNLLLEPTRLTMLYVIVGNVFFAMLLGSFLSAVYETPWLKTQRRIMSHIR